MTRFHYTIYNQYANSQRLLSIIKTFADAADLNDFTDIFIEKIWDIKTCHTWGLDMWGKYVGATRYVKPAISGDNIFGFFEAKDNNPGIINYPQPFDQAPFFDYEAGGVDVIELTDDAYRAFILAKAFSNISITTIPQINRFLRILFSNRPDTFCIFNGGFELVVNIVYILPYELTLLINYNALPIPSGVKIVVKAVNITDIN